VRVDISKGEKVGTRLGGEADGSKIEKFPFLSASDGRSLRVYSLDPCDPFGGSEVSEVARVQNTERCAPESMSTVESLGLLS
jgi:hypothetical protein